MYNLSRRDPFREMITLRSAVDRLFDSAFNGESDWAQSSWGVALDVTENENEYTVKATVPGVNPDDIDITFNNGMLTIKGEVKANEEKQGERYHMRERRYGSFSRSIALPTSINPDSIQASYDAGILTLHLPKAEEAKPKRIQIQSSGSQKVIEGQSKN